MTREPILGNRVSKQPKTAERAKTSERVFGGVVGDTISRSLQAHFDDIAHSPIPDKFLVLLAELEAKEARGEN